MSTNMSGIDQAGLFAKLNSVQVQLPEDCRYKLLSDALPWSEMGKIANRHRGKKVNLNTGRALNLRLHLGALVGQSLNNWTDRATEEMIRYHGGVRILCDIGESNQSLDRSSIESFRSALGQEGLEELKGLVEESILKHKLAQEDELSPPNFWRRVSSSLRSIGSLFRRSKR